MTIDGWIPDPNFLANENISEKQRNIEKERLTAASKRSRFCSFSSVIFSYFQFISGIIE